MHSRGMRQRCPCDPAGQRKSWVKQSRGPRGGDRTEAGCRGGCGREPACGRRRSACLISLRCRGAGALDLGMGLAGVYTIPIPYHGRPLSEAQNPTAHLRYLAVHLCQHFRLRPAFALRRACRFAGRAGNIANPHENVQKTKNRLLCGFDLHDTVLRTVYVTYPIFRRQHYAPAA